MDISFVITVTIGVIAGIIAAICITIKEEKEEKDDI